MVEAGGQLGELAGSFGRVRTVQKTGDEDLPLACIRLARRWGGENGENLDDLQPRRAGPFVFVQSAIRVLSGSGAHIVIGHRDLYDSDLRVGHEFRRELVMRGRGVALDSILHMERVREWLDRLDRASAQEIPVNEVRCLLPGSVSLELHDSKLLTHPTVSSVNDQVTVTIR